MTLTTTPTRPAGPARAAIPPHRPPAPTPPIARLLDAKAAAQLLNVPHTWVLAQARAGTVPHHRLGHYVRFDPHDLAQWLAAEKHTPRQRRL